MKIGFFDSGLGGLTILKAVGQALPQYDYEYYGDTAHLPYGDKPEREIYALTRAGVEHLFARDCVLVIIACNTASAETLRRLQDEYLPESPYADRRILGVIIPVVEEVVESGVCRALLVATQRTVSSGKYHLELGKRNVTATKVEAVATPELVPLIERGELDAAYAVLTSHLDRGVGEVDGLILGCTHYAVLRERLARAYGDRIKIFSPDTIIPEKLATYLVAHPEIEGELSRGGTRTIFLTEQRPDYDPAIETLLGGILVGEG